MHILEGMPIGMAFPNIIDLYVVVEETADDEGIAMGHDREVRRYLRG